MCANFAYPCLPPRTSSTHCRAPISPTGLISKPSGSKKGQFAGLRLAFPRRVLANYAFGSMVVTNLLTIE
jgi:hypothetical protein